MTLYEYLESLGYSEYDIELTSLYYIYGFKMPEKVHNDVMYWIYHIKH